MSVQSVILQGRAFTEVLMDDRCVIVSRARSIVLNEETGDYDIVDSPIYDGPCKFKAGTVGVQEIDVQGQQRIEQEAVLSLPVDAPGSGDVDKNHIALITECAMDAALVGVHLRIVTPHRQSYATARRFRVEETR